MMFVLCISFASADVGISQSQFKFNNDYVDTGVGGNSLIAGGTGNSFNSTIYKLGGYSLKFDGNGYAYKNSINWTTGNSAKTITFWMNVSSLPSTINFVYELGNNSAYGDSCFMYLYNNTGTQQVLPICGSGGTAITYSFPVNKWVFVAIKHNANKSNELYINGTYIGQSTQNEALNLLSTGGLYVGSAYGGGSKIKANTYIDDFRIYQGTLTSANISDIYNGGLGTESNPIVAEEIFTFNTPSDVSQTKYLPTNYIRVNVSINMTNFQNASINLFNTSGLVSSYFTTNTTQFVNFTNLVNGTYYYNVTARNTTSQNVSSTITNYILYSVLNISFYDSFYRRQIQNFSVTLISSDSTLYYSGSTTSYFNILNIIKDVNYSLSASLPSGYDSYSANYSFNSSYTFLNISLYPRYFVNISLINEANGSLFNCSSLYSCKLYYGDSTSYVWDFKTSSSANVSVDLSNGTKFRVELIYPTSFDVVNRYFDVTVVPDPYNVRVCANYINVTHYENLIYSASNRPVIMVNPFSNCLIAGDYTRFAYQDTFILRAFTVDAPYYLYTLVGDAMSFLVGIDGGISLQVNLDTLQFRTSTVPIDILSSSLQVWSNVSLNQSIIKYYNQEENNVNVSVLIANSVTGVIYLSTDIFLNPNNFSLLFDYSSLNSSDNLYIVSVCPYTLEGASDCEVKYFNLVFNYNGESGMPTGVAFALALFLVITAFTFASISASNSWFGILLLVIALLVLASSTIEWFTLMFMGIIIIVILFLVFSQRNSNKGWFT
jgi:hypothetical protein